MSVTQSLEHELQVYAPTVDRYFPYGTAGFRSVGQDMRHVLHRSGLLAVLFSLKTNNQPTGICITGSHNPSQDNGVKFSGSGSGIDEEFEVFAEEFVNAKKPVDYFNQLCQKFHVDLLDSSAFSRCCVYCGTDTRKTSPFLYGCVKAAVEFLGARVVDLGIATTPQVHFVVQTANQRNLREAVTVEEYYKHFSQQFSEFLQLCGNTGRARSRFLRERVVCDGANGVGAIRVDGFKRVLNDCINVDLEIRNDGTWPEDELNFKCGTEYVQKEMHVPKRFGSSVYDPMYLRCCSFDGDADRVVYHTTNSSGHLILVDGDKIGCLYGMAIAKLLKDIIQIGPDVKEEGHFQELNILSTFVANARSRCVHCFPHPVVLCLIQCRGEPLCLASIQTAYANGASTRFYSDLVSQILSSCQSQVTFEVCCVKTGVKNLHRRASKYDIAIYFESNGHGTVTAKMGRLEEWARQTKSHETTAFRRLRCFLNIFNQATGDAMANVLAVEAALKYLEVSFMEWIRIYAEFPCVQRRVQMKRSFLNLLKPHPEHEKYLLEPLKVQEEIDSAKRAYSNSRAFIRPSGTEDVCRLYAEADTLDSANRLCDDVERALRNYFVPGTE